MPPAKNGKSLTEAQKNLLERWIRDGADWPIHWAFLKPERTPIPTVRNTAWPRNAIDNFVLARLEQEGWSPAAEADKVTLIRRVTVDLTGLPPTPAEVDAFMADTSAGAYEALVDRLLKSEHFGEHLARYWLDAVRYADSNGYDRDWKREIWPYRDWVINAYNRNLRFDEFTVHQLAGDLLTNLNTAKLVASGYLRCNLTTSEGGVIPAEYDAKYGFDRTETTATVWMGLTLTCARCHNHKYDPLSQRDYYGLFAFFNSLDVPVLDGNQALTKPYIQVASSEHIVLREQAKRDVEEAQKKLEALDRTADEARLAWQDSWHRRLTNGWTVLRPVSIQSARTTNGQFQILEDHSVLIPGPAPMNEIYDFRATLTPGVLGAVWLEAIPHPSLPTGGSGRGVDGSFQLIEIEGNLMVPDAVGTGEHPVALKFAQAAADLADVGHDAVRSIDGNPVSGWSLSGPRSKDRHRAVFSLAEPVTIPPGVSLHLRLRFGGAGPDSALGHFAIAAGQDASLLDQLLPRKEEVWQVIGPFESESLAQGLSRVFPPETEFDPTRAYPGAREEVRWRLQPEFGEGQQNLLVHRLDGIHGAYYFRRTLTTDAAREVEITLSADEVFKVWLNGALVRQRVVPEERSEGPARITVSLRPGENVLLIKVVNHFDAAYFNFESSLLGVDRLPPELSPILAVTGRPDADLGAKVRHYYQRKTSRDFKEAYQSLLSAKAAQQGIDTLIPKSLVAKELAHPRPARVLLRGEYDHPGDEVPPSVPGILPPLPADAVTNRLSFARWLVHPDHPLTARVAVNRFWQQYFGAGLVRTPEDFGTQGELPSHPELLDWLATEFVRTGWDMKRLQRLMVTSRTYRQSSRTTPEMRDRDPENRLLGRGARQRYDAEVLRDAALRFAGLLVNPPGGRSIRPVQPAGLWESVSFNGSERYVPEAGPDKYRRSLYIYWKRQSPPPNMLLFDAPTREYCVVKRLRTNTPLQALAALNDPQRVEATRAFAQRILQEGGDSVASRIRFAFRTVLARFPEAEEVDVIRRLLDQEVAAFRQAPADVDALQTVGDFRAQPGLPAADLAAWSSVATLLFNLDEAMTKE